MKSKFYALILLLSIVISTKIVAVERLSAKIALSSQPSSLLAIIASKKGFFKDAGIDITLVKYSSGKTALLEGVFKNNAEIASVADIPVVKAVQEKRKMQIIASISRSDDMNRIIARKDSGIRRPEDLLGKKIGTQKNSAVHYFLDRFLSYNKINKKKLSIEFDKAVDLPNLIISRKIDAFSMREPFISIAKRGLVNNHITFSAKGAYIQNEFLVINEKDHIQHPSISENVIKALVIAEQFVKKNKKETVMIYSDWAGVSFSESEKAISAVYPEVTLRQLHVTMMELQMKWLELVNGRKLDKSINLLKFIDSRPLRKINNSAVTLIE